ncbi:MAG: DUF5320 domain-containing protein [Deltaproteobacteria bacterium]|nr:DUF5320 domain-containing protein [Deltaproteobacteria bacterium]
MPGRNGRGPMGMGPKTGRGAGYCGGPGDSEYWDTARDQEMRSGRGGGFGAVGGNQAGGGRGRRHMFYATGVPGWLRNAPSAMPFQQQEPKADAQSLANQIESLQKQLDRVKQQLAAIEPESDE